MPLQNYQYDTIMRQYSKTQSQNRRVQEERTKEIYEKNRKKQGGGIRKLGSASGKVGTTLKKVGGKIAHGVLYAAGFTYLVGQELTKKKPEAETKPENTEKEAGKNG